MEIGTLSVLYNVGFWATTEDQNWTVGLNPEAGAESGGQASVSGIGTMLELNGQRYVSSPFSFLAYCLTGQAKVPKSYLICQNQNCKRGSGLLQ